MDSRLRRIDGEQNGPFIVYKSLIEGESIVEDQFREGFIDGVVTFLNEPIWQVFEKKLILPFDQLTDLVWKIKETREFQDKIGVRGNNVEKVRLRVLARKYLDKSFLSAWHMDINKAKSAELIAVTGKLVKKLERVLDDLKGKYYDTIHMEQISIQLMLPDYPLLMMIAMNLWLEIGKVLEEMTTRLEKLKYSIRVIGSPMTVNQRLIETSYLSLHRVCGTLKEVTAALNAESNPYNERVLLDVLDRSKISPSYQEKIVDKMTEILSSLEDRSRIGKLVLPNGFEEMVGRFKTGFIELFIKLNRMDLQEASTDMNLMADTSIQIEEKPPKSFLFEKMLGLISELLDHGLISEAEVLVRAYQLCSNQFELEEYINLANNFEQWRDCEQRTKTLLQESRKQRLRLA